MTIRSTWHFLDLGLFDNLLDDLGDNLFDLDRDFLGYDLGLTAGGQDGGAGNSHRARG